MRLRDLDENLMSRKKYSTGAIVHLADYMIAYYIKSADVERVGSHMQLIKTKLRTSLSDQTLKLEVTCLHFL